MQKCRGCIRKSGVIPVEVKEFLCAAGCGFLLARGLAGGARCAGWEMPSLMGTSSGSIWGAVLFGLAFVTCCVLLRDSGKRTEVLLNCLTAAMYTLHRILFPSTPGRILMLADGVAVLWALMLAGKRKHDAGQIAVLALLLIFARFCPLPPVEPLMQLRLSALTGTLSAAGMCGAAMAGLTERSSRNGSVWIAVGAAAGLL